MIAESTSVGTVRSYLRYRYSLRVLIASFTFATLILGMTCVSIHAQKSRVQYLQQRGVRVKFMEPIGHTAILRRAAAYIFGAEGAYEVVELEFGTRFKLKEDLDAGLFQMEIVNEDLKDLKRFSNLQRINLSGTKITDKGIEYLCCLQSLRSLILDNTSISDHTLDMLSENLELAEVSIVNTQVSPTAVRNFRERRRQCALRTADVEVQLRMPIRSTDTTLLSQ